jgi:DNA helicase-2/ATP-dependent DNA helicase PcrA
MPLSYSQISTYRRCPKQYEYASIKRIPRPLSAGGSFGSSIHNTLKKWGEAELRKQPSKLTSGQLTLFIEEHTHDRDSELTLTTLLNFWRASFIAEGYESRAEMDAKLANGERALTHFFDWWNTRKRDVVAVEKSFKFSLPDRKDIVLSGRFDRVERDENGLMIIDYKSTSPRSQETLDNDLQLSVYAIASAELWKEPVQHLSLLCIGKDGIVEQKTLRSQKQLDDALTTIRLIADRIEGGDFAATPGIEKCSYCPYRDLCPARATT